MEHAYDFSANTNSLARYLRSGRKVIIWQGTEDTLVSHIDTAHAYEQLGEPGGERRR